MEYTEERQAPDVITSDTENATKIQPKEASPERREQFRRFRAYNTGTWNGPKRENKCVMYRQDNLHRFDAISSTLGLTDSQKERGRELFGSLDLNQFNRGSESVDSVIFGLAVLLANDDVYDGTRYWPHEDAGGNDELFQEFAQDIGLDVNDQMSIVQRLRAKVNL